MNAVLSALPCYTSMESENKAALSGQNSRCLVRTNDVAPIIIRDCREEFQHVSDFKEPIVYGSICVNMPEHPLIKGKYFLVKDETDKIDAMKTYHQFKAPNFHQVKKGVPVYGAGQPTAKGLNSLLNCLSDEGFSEIFLFNLREEPVLFVDNGLDMIPFSIRDHDNLNKVVILGRNPYEADEAEARIRKEVIDLATFREENKFYFYKDMENLQREPHEIHVQYEDNLLVSEEVYARHVMCSHCVRYQRLCFPDQMAPSESDVDTFIDLFKECPCAFDKNETSKIAMLFTCQTGYGRSTLGMAMGTLLISHKRGFSSILSKGTAEKRSSQESGEFQAVKKLISYFPNGNLIRLQTDYVIDLCSELYNLRKEVMSSKQLLDSVTEDCEIGGRSSKEGLYRECCNYLQRYMFLICFNAYLTEQYPLRFIKSFTKWMHQHPNVTRLCGNVHHPCAHAPTNLVFTDSQYLVSDDYIGLDVLSTQMDVKVSNFRRINVKGFSVYGMAQPARDGVTKISNHLLSKKQGHTFLVLINLRNDVAVECDGKTYSIRDAQYLEEPIIHPSSTRQEIEEKEESLEKEIKAQKTVEVYNEISAPAEQMEFHSILSPSELADTQKLQTLDMQYYRIPLRYDTTPTEEDFDDLMGIICEHWLQTEKNHKNIAFVYYCRTGKSRTTLAMAVTGLVLCHIKGFPKGSFLGEQERVSCPNAQYTKGDFMIVQKLVRLLPCGQQVKREVDFILDECFETMSPMHFHIREVIFVTYNKIAKAKTEADKQQLKRQSIDFLERYIYLILFNMYLHQDKNLQWQRSFSKWMKEVAARSGVYELLNNLAFYDFEKVPTTFKTMKDRWRNRSQPIPYRGVFR